MDWALSVTGPKLSTAMMTGAMARKPKATRPKAKIGAANMNCAGMSASKAGVLRKHVGGEHQRDDHQPHPERAEIAGDEARQDVQRRAALARAGDDFFHVPGLGADEDFGEFHDERPGQRAAGNDAGQHPPQVGIRRARRVRNPAQQELAGGEGDHDGNDGGQPDQIRQRLFPIEILFVGCKASC